jgi:hypothetical protein
MDKSKARVYKLSHNEALKNCMTDIRECGLNAEYEVIVRPIKSQKTLAMLGAIFGVWMEYLEQQTGHTQDYYHRFWKSKFLSKIYAADHTDDEAKSYIKEIDQWVELLLIYQETDLTEKFTEHSKRISLSWANLSQTKRYMNMIDAYYIDAEMPLPVPDKFHKYYEQVKKTKI